MSLRLCTPQRLPGGGIHIALFSAEHDAFYAALNAGGTPWAQLLPMAVLARERQAQLAAWSRSPWVDPIV